MGNHISAVNIPVYREEENALRIEAFNNWSMRYDSSSPEKKLHHDFGQSIRIVTLLKLILTIPVQY
jgi:hypothetical protein